MAKKNSKQSPAELNIHNQVKSFFKDKHNVLLVFLFGSYASRQMKTSSDIDIGVLFDETPSFYEMNGLKENLSEVIKREVDLVVLNNASPIIKMQVIKKGIMVFQRYKNDFSAFYGETVKQYDDLKIIRRKCEDNILKGRIYA
ncbi:MAG: nucleotidyltransferase domain-containing protein [Nitrospirae bacterium]|nr:nucleotidyltransferase domain-containing protein [Nitrospirota bacterium]